MLPRKFLIGITYVLLALFLRSAIVKAADTHSCYYCGTEDCEDPVTTECKTVTENNQCFFRFEPISNNVVQMGCVSDSFEEEDIKELITNKTLYVCDGVNCNDFQKLPNRNQCTECSSINVEACATKPATLTNLQPCNNIPYSQCVQRVVNTTTYRGCLYDLPGTEFYQCLTGGDKNCKICEGRNCNLDIIPQDRKQCQLCSSETDENCESSPAASSVCPLYQEKDTCVAIYENGITKRGCRSEFGCDPKLKNCQVCSPDGCNTANIKRRFDDIYAAFQDVPLNCNTCEDDDCAPGKPLFPNVCTGDEYQDCITVFDNSSKVSQRGCENMVLAKHQSHCDSHPELCFKCKANGCNNMTDPTKYQECLSCDAATNPDCWLKPSAINTTRKCSLGCVTSLYPRKSNPKVFDLGRACLEDIERDNQKSCTPENNCITCSENKCNDVLLAVDNHLSCLHCEGPNCDTPTSKQCTGYNPNDMCYIYFDNVTFSATRMGCRSDVADDKLRLEIKQFFICDGDNCNNYDNLPKAIFCLSCNSNTDVNCAINPSKVTQQTRCDTPYAQCYSRILSDGSTERGCLSELSTDDFISCHDGHPDSICRVCTENTCNNRVYPGNRQYCQRCNSTTDGNCTFSPNTKQVCPRYKPDDGCVTQYIDGNTRRDCASEITCEDLGYRNCRYCSNNGCNDVALVNEDIGDLGIFTDLPLRCLFCTNIEKCKNLNVSLTEVCEGNKFQSCTTVFNNANVVTSRGCSDRLETACSQEGNMCFNCKSNDCNRAENKYDYIDCIHCDSRKNSNCTSNVDAVENTRKCYKSCMTALYPRTEDKDPVYELTRSCLDDKDLEGSNMCSANEDSKCISCKGKKCNTADLGSHKSCYQCKGDACLDPKAQTCRAVMDNDQCLQRWDESGELVEMGCKSDYDPLEVDVLIKRKYLWLCDDDNCNHIENSPKPQTCAVCNSKTDAKCATEPNAILATTECTKLPYPQCYSRLLDNGHTERGCLSNLEAEDFVDCLLNKNSSKCSACTGHKCNQELYPENRISCHSCSSDSSDTCESKPNATQVCLLYSSDEKCTTLVDINGNTMRGCNSKLNCNAANVTVCQECEGNACNAANLKRKADGKPGQWQSLPLTCLSCKNAKECSTGSKREECSGSEHCMTIFGPNDQVVQRGCSDVVEKDQGDYCDLNSSNCLNCNSNLCNNADSQDQLIDCVYCDSVNNPDCVHNPLAVKYLRKCNGFCMTALYPTSNKDTYNLGRGCLDDMEADDQKSCSNGNSTECKSCSSPKCNIDKLPENRLSCYQCHGENCEDAPQSVCSKYKSDDQCFIQFNNISDIVRMGCISDLEENFVSNNLHLLYMCSSGDNCNSYDNLPPPTVCAVCNSYEDEDCATNPSNLQTVTKCSALPNTQCYTKVYDESSTERGCVNSLPEKQIKACLLGTDIGCSVCTSDTCNMEVFPADRRMCYRCNTKDDSECESVAKSSSICPVYSKNQSCATKYVNGHTYRGCSTEFQCDDNDKQHCRSCHGSDNCNIVDLASSYVGYPGNWQDLPINCYTCKNEECNQQVPIQACRDNDNQNCATVFGPNGTVVQRGCSDLIYSDEYSNYCDENPKKCKFCKSSGCNLAKSLTDFNDCLFCEGTDNLDCILQPENINRTRSCHKGCLAGLYPRKYEENPAYLFARGCLDDMDLDDRESCRAGTNPYCQVCDGTSCNTALLPKRRLKCNVCNGEDCEEPKSAVCTAFRENDQCHILFDDENNVESMGCASDFDNSDLNLLARQLLLCNGDNCNNFESFPTPTLCRSCNSEDDPDCASNPTKSPASTCQHFPDTKCYTRVKNGVTYRGCSSELAEDDFAECVSGNGTSCEICSENNCNAKIYPEDRRMCIQCDSATYLDCEDNPQYFANVCNFYDKNESCVTKLEGDRTIRGCSSQISCDNNSSQTCRICNSKDNCNTINLQLHNVGEPGKWQKLPLSCHQCQGGECSNGNVSLIQCERNNLQTCMTIFNDKDSVVERGCSDNVIEKWADYCDENTDKCFSCKSNACNDAKSLADYIDCYSCDSSDNSQCAVNFDGSKSKTRKCQKSCMVALYPRSSGNDSAYELNRNCLNDMEVEDQNKCSNGDNDLCKACDSPRCNIMDVLAERFECYKCVGNDCEDTESQQCSSYHANEQCYVLFNNESSIVAMGCRSEFETHVANDLVKRKQLLLCNGKNCNAPEALPTPKACSVCNSAENPLCATNPNLVNNIQRCNTLPYSDCFTRITADGHTIRGCLGSLEGDAFYDCLTNADGLCETCMGDKCNEIDVYPNDRRKCHQCTSASDKNCTSAPSSNKVCKLYRENDRCVTHFRDGLTIRGCRSDMLCDDENDPKTCRACTSDGCNTINVEKLFGNGLPGRWQDVPITCHTCLNEQECSSMTYYRPCEGNPFQNCMTVFDSNGKVVRKGCSDAVDSENRSYCNENPEKCLHCSSNGCNEATSLSEYVECAHCDNDSSGNCVNNVTGIETSRLCHKFCMTALYPLFEEENPSYGLTRSCYNDMDYDDREECAAGKKEHCQVCNSTNCNTINMPEKRLSCYICEKNNCQNAKPQTCPTYRSNDKCITLFDEKQEVVELGCLSKLSNAEAYYLLKKQRLLPCDEENCNSMDNIPASETCVLCNSRTDKNCAVSPADVNAETVCAVRPHTKCYTRVLADGATERGCLSNLYGDEFLGCFNGTSTTCKSCSGLHCNKDIFPDSRLMCHVCDSSKNASCEARPNSLKTCSLYDPEDTCVTAYRNNVTYRDCSSSLQCDIANSKVCRKCSGNGCNTVNLAKQNDGNFGMWQDLPLTCQSCEGKNCSSAANTTLLTCEQNNEQDCVTVFDDNDSVIARGCSDNIWNKYCLGNEDNCFNCKSNKCNSASSKLNYEECIYCNSFIDQNCVRNPLSTGHKTRKCQGGCMTALFPSDNLNNSANHVMRSCLNDKEPKDQKLCSTGKDIYCSACSGSQCNDNNVPENRLSCFECEGETCEEPKANLCTLYKENDQCFIKFDSNNSVSEMGCISSFGSHDLETIIKTKRVFTCLGSNCNSLDKLPSAQYCAACDSSDDMSCAVSPTEISSLNYCTMLPHTSCFSKLTDDGKTKRGCLTDLPANEFAACLLGNDENCGVCSGGGCNREIYPADRQQCFTCTSTEESNCDSFPTTKKPCHIVSDTESCVTALSGNVTVRGCKSLVHCDANDSSTCRSCSGSECNSIELLNKYDDGYHGVWQELPLRCHTCEGEDCLHSLGPSLSCSSRNIYQDCMTVFDEAGRVKHRGCSDDVEDYRDLYCRQNPERCFKCKSNECNMAWSIEEYVECLFCDSSKDPLCVLDPDNNEMKSRKCYKNCMAAMTSLTLVRSCLDDKEQWVQHVCAQNDSKECAACSDHSCNNFVFPRDRLRCHTCSGSSCNASVSQSCVLYDNNDFCYAKYDNGKVGLMGCASSQNASDIAQWAAENVLHKCEGNDCNQLSLLPKEGVCVSCNSSIDLNCAQNPLQVVSTETCQAPNDKCVSLIDAQGHTIRQCQSSLPGSEQSCESLGTCEVCTGEKCNNQIYPANRPACQICSSETDEDCRKNPSSYKTCPLYDPNDKCVSALKESGVLQRGCASELTCSVNDNKHCDICDTNGCNTIELTDSANIANISLFLTLLMALVSVLVLKY